MDNSILIFEEYILFKNNTNQLKQTTASADFLVIIETP